MSSLQASVYHTPFLSLTAILSFAGQDGKVALGPPEELEDVVAEIRVLEVETPTDRLDEEIPCSETTGVSEDPDVGLLLNRI